MLQLHHIHGRLSSSCFLSALFQILFTFLPQLPKEIKNNITGLRLNQVIWNTVNVDYCNVLMV
jgi:hypothetical protein